MKITTRRLMVGGGLLAAVLLALFAFLLWPDDPGTTKRSTMVAKHVKEDVHIPNITHGEPPPFREPTDVLERLGIDSKVTPHCAIINQWHDRNVPMWVILKNVDAQAMFFDEKELECLTASPLPPGILDTAEQRIRVPNPPGRRNPGGQVKPVAGG